MECKSNEFIYQQQCVLSCPSGTLIQDNFCVSSCQSMVYDLYNLTCLDNVSLCKFYHIINKMMACVNTCFPQFSEN